MKSKEEIQRMATICENFKKEESLEAQCESSGRFHGFIAGYNQCQKDLNIPLDSKGGFSEPPKEYLPYGKEWEKEMMKVPKKFIIDMVRNKQVEIDNLRNKLYTKWDRIVPPPSRDEPHI